MFGFKKKDGDVPPDVGQEEKYDAEKISSGESNDVDSKMNVSGIKAPEEVRSQGSGVSSGGNVAINDFQLEKVSARVDSVVEWIKQFYERFSYISESIGEIRTMNIENEKKISQATREAEMVIDVVKEVKPEQLRMDYQKAELKMNTLAEKIEANKQFMSELMNEMNDLRRKSEVFVGTEGLMKLNEDTKKDLISLQKLASITKMQADKGQEIFMEIRKGFAESQKSLAIMKNLDESYSGVRDEIEKLRLGRQEVVRYSDYLEFKKTYGDKLAVFEGNIGEVVNLKRAVDELGNLVETNLSAARRNEEDIAKLGMKIGVDDVKGVDDYENQMNDVVSIIETLASELAEVRTRLGMDSVEGKIVLAKEKLGMIEPAISGGMVENATDIDLPVLPVKKVVKRVARKAPVKNVVVQSVPSVKPVIMPSENPKTVSEVASVKLPELPKLKPKEFLGRENILMKKMEDDIEKIRDISDVVEGDVVKSGNVVE